ncbi:MAG: hypothetical protein WAU31_04775 [Candidatus Moraniibacteriota bacterium]
MSKKTLILATFFVLIVILGGAFWIAKEKFERMALEKADQEEVAKQAAMQQVSDADFAKYNKVLSRDKITGVQDLEGPYKKVTVSNGELTFSFEVPDKWLVETRNSGEVTMNEGELREFLGTNYDGDIRSEEVCTNEDVYDANGKMTIEKFCGKPYSDYSGMDWNTLKSISYKDMQKRYLDAKSEFSPGFPNATVTPDNKIWYTDTGWDQVHFYILDKVLDSQYKYKYKYIRGITSFCYDTECLQKDYLEYRENIEKRAKRDENRNVIIDKGEMHGFAETIDLGNNKVLRIWKEAYAEGEFEDGFKRLIDTLTFE